MNEYPTNVGSKPYGTPGAVARGQAALATIANSRGIGPDDE